MPASTDRLVASLYDVDSDTKVVLETVDGSRIQGQPSRIDRDQAGVRIEICPYRGDAPQYRIRAERTVDGWRTPSVERCGIDGKWKRDGSLAALKTSDPAGP